MLSMVLTEKKAFLFLLILLSCSIDHTLQAKKLIASNLGNEAHSKGFVYLCNIKDTDDIKPSLRLVSLQNFAGMRMKGFSRKDQVVLTKKTAKKLKKVQRDVQEDDYSLVIYNAYHPQDTDDQLMNWAADLSDQKNKADYYPNVDKSELINLGYITPTSANSVGRTVEVTLIEKNKKLQTIVKRKRILQDGSSIVLLDDGTVDMGSSYGLFDKASHTDDNGLLAPKFKKRRMYLRRMMAAHGFVNTDPTKWWLFTLVGKPNTDDNQHFNFHVQ